ncbi:nuclear transport factor 2 family protein [Phytoactinopolyspora halotolerans]|uniref:Nuclear transport factor 2 family protein n=1 Tax=Phytoactinopolyspora halotolerans TaxID=1981512 RepID=A0A6L9S4W2_9ACTN|nr:nuclear transport factor 2 family protein [Phytoactinopolyspora halotolerans]NEE00077.1 nuclear transport factor 2 family protein [Phytoactinopolyspora halotolerans]
MSTSDAGIADVVVGMLRSVDDLDWAAVRSALAAKVSVDYTSLWGGEPVEMDGDELVASWRRLVPGFDATQHMIGPVTVTGDDGRTATCITDVRAYHRVVDDGDAATWMVAGRYVLTMERVADRWRIRGITLRTTYEDGSRTLADTATQRVAGGRGRGLDGA